MVGMELFCGTADNSPFGTPTVLRMLIGRDERIFTLVSDEIKESGDEERKFVGL
jgi:hypothetical protein